jgi:hypothetical protein
MRAEIRFVGFPRRYLGSAQALSGGFSAIRESVP